MFMWILMLFRNLHGDANSRGNIYRWMVDPKLFKRKFLQCYSFLKNINYKHFAKSFIKVQEKSL